MKEQAFEQAQVSAVRGLGEKGMGAIFRTLQRLFSKRFIRSAEESADGDKNDAIDAWSFVSPEVRSLDVVVVTSSDLDLRSCASDLRHFARSLTYFADPETAWRWLDGRSGSETILLVDLDAFEDIEEAVEMLLELRKSSPFFTVVMLSSTFDRNDFSDERKAIADCSLRLPTNATTLGISLGAARTNSRARLQGSQDDFHRVL